MLYLVLEHGEKQNKTCLELERNQIKRTVLISGQIGAQAFYIALILLLTFLKDFKEVTFKTF